MSASVTRAVGLEAGAPRSAVRPATAALRGRLRWASVAVDLGAALVGYELALIVMGWFHHVGLRFFTDSFDWIIPLYLAIVLVTFLWLGLYKLEAYVSRPLHLLSVAKGSVVALVITAFLAFAFKSPMLTESRLTIFSSFAIFFTLSAILRLWLLDRWYRDDLRRHPGGAEGRPGTSGRAATAARSPRA